MSAHKDFNGHPLEVGDLVRVRGTRHKRHITELYKDIPNGVRLNNYVQKERGGSMFFSWNGSDVVIDPAYALDKALAR